MEFVNQPCCPPQDSWKRIGARPSVSNSRCTMPDSDGFCVWLHVPVETLRFPPGTRKAVWRCEGRLAALARQDSGGAAKVARSRVQSGHHLQPNGRWDGQSGRTSGTFVVQAVSRVVVCRGRPWQHCCVRRSATEESLEYCGRSTRGCTVALTMHDSHL